MCESARLSNDFMHAAGTRGEGGGMRSRKGSGRRSRHRATKLCLHQSLCDWAPCGCNCCVYQFVCMYVCTYMSLRTTPWFFSLSHTAAQAALVNGDPLQQAYTGVQQYAGIGHYSAL